MRSYYCCCCISEPLILSHCVRIKLGHRFYALFKKVCSDRDNMVPWTLVHVALSWKTSTSACVDSTWMLGYLLYSILYVKLVSLKTTWPISDKFVNGSHKFQEAGGIHVMFDLRLLKILSFRSWRHPYGPHSPPPNIFHGVSKNPFWFSPWGVWEETWWLTIEGMMLSIW